MSKIIGIKKKERPKKPDPVITIKPGESLWGLNTKTNQITVFEVSFFQVAPNTMSCTFGIAPGVLIVSAKTQKKAEEKFISILKNIKDGKETK